jgi:hypothetical protein
MSKLYTMWREDRMTRIGEVGLWVFYEHPTRGDEAPLIAERAGWLYYTDWWELPTEDELEGWEPEGLTCRHCGETMPAHISLPGEPDCPHCGRDN